MEEPFVKSEDGVLKIHEFEKCYITLLVKAEIDRVEAEHKKLREDTTIEPKFKEMNERAMRAVEGLYLRDLKIVLKRVEAMPATRW